MSAVCGSVSPEPNYPSNRIRSIAVNIPIESDKVYDLRESLNLNGHEIDLIMEGKETLWIYGFVEFQDFMMNTWRDGFIVKLRLLGRGSGGQTNVGTFEHGREKAYAYHKMI